MAQLTDEEILQQQYEKHKKRKEDEDKGGFEYGKEDKLPVPFNEYTVVRFAGMPREYFYSFIICDDEKYKVIKFPSEDDPNFILTRVAKKVLERVYLGKDEKGKAMFEYPVSQSHPEIFKMVENNGKDVYGKFGPSGWTKLTGKCNRGTVANVINRKAFSTVMKDKDDKDVIRNYGADWCKENKHTLLLTSGMKDNCTAATLLDKLMGELYPIKGSFMKYDVAMHRTKDEPWYTLASGKDVTEGSKNGAPEMVKIASLIKEGDLLEEQQYERYDLEAMTRVTSYKDIYSWLKIKIGAIDAALGTSFLQELETLVKQEGGTVAPSGQYSGEKTKEEKKESASPFSEIPQEEEKEETPAPAARPARRAAPAATGGVNMDSIRKIAPFVDGLTDEEKKEITGFDGNKVLFQEPEAEWLDCSNPSCGRPSTTRIVSQCLYCGTKF